MGNGPCLSRREILNAVPLLGSGGLLVPVAGQPAGRGPAGVVRGVIGDAATGSPAAAKLRVTEASTGAVFMPASCIKTMPRKGPNNVRYFYARGGYEVAVPPGRYRIEVVRGICHEPAAAEVEVAPGAAVVKDFSLARFWDARRSGWYSGNTHTHYNVDIEESVDERLRLVPEAEDVDVSVISYLIRNRLPYASNRLPVGRLPGYPGGPILDMGEECRNNFPPNSIPNGYGHCLFLNIPRLIEPVSTGLLAPDGKAPDFPTLSMLCEQAHRIGGTTVWCHNGTGLEAPVAIALGHVDALNIADGHPVEYDWYYRFLNCGLRLPISSGTDWWEYDHNRVFVRADPPFSYESWLAGLRAGRTFISNGPLLELTVNGRGPGATLPAAGLLRLKAAAVSRVAFERLEIVAGGEIVASKAAAGGKEAAIEHEFTAPLPAWIAARVTGRTTTATGYPVFAHTNPIYVRTPGRPRRLAEAARAVASQVEAGMDLVRKRYRFSSEADRDIALGRFGEGLRFYQELGA